MRVEGGVYPGGSEVLGPLISICLYSLVLGQTQSQPIDRHDANMLYGIDSLHVYSLGLGANRLHGIVSETEGYLGTCAYNDHWACRCDVHR